jgi:ergothioneine biosynthesis protein EgtB
MHQRYKNVRDYSVAICKPLEKEDYVVQPMPDASPPKWHLAHVTWFLEEMLLARHLEGYRRFHPRYAFLFNSYYNSLGDRVLRPQRGNMSRPSVDEILEYRAYVDQHMLQLIDVAPKDVLDLIEVSLHHEQQHQELLFTDIKYILGHNPLFPVYNREFKETTSVHSSNEFIKIPRGVYQIGHDGNGFAFDNESQRHEVLLNDFEIRKSLVTNREFLEFINSGGYENPLHWHSDGWTWVQENRIANPLYWHKTDNVWMRYSLAGLEPLPMDEPVTHISHYEAFAYSEWMGMRLPTEFEWEAASDQFDWGQRWEHTSSSYLPYPGFTKPPGALGEYNGKFMINQMVLRGASVVTPPGHARKTYRNFFHANVQWQFNGIRLCKK